MSCVKFFNPFQSQYYAYLIKKKNRSFSSKFPYEMYGSYKELKIATFQFIFVCRAKKRTILFV